MKGINYPVSIQQINKFENQNPNISVNIFTFEDGDVIPLRISKQIENTHHIDLLLLHSEENSHYISIKNLNNFLSLRNGKRNKFFFVDTVYMVFSMRNCLKIILHTVRFTENRKLNYRPLKSVALNSKILKKHYVFHMLFMQTLKHSTNV